MRFAALGRTHWLYDSIQSAVSRGHQPVLIGTAAPSPEYTRDEAAFAGLATELGCPFFGGGRLHDAATLQLIDRSGAEVAISVNWPTLIGPDIRRRFRHGILNAHAGDLPRFRGNACPNWAILAGERQMVVTVHEMADELDAGPVMAKRACPIGEHTYIHDLYAFMTAAIPEMFADVLDAVAAGSAVPAAQSLDPADALRCYPRRPDDGYLDWSGSAEWLGRLVRASAEPFAGAFFIRDGQKVLVWRAHAKSAATPSLGVPGQVVSVDRSTGTVGVLAGDGSVLVLEQLQLPGEARVPAAAIIRSTSERLGFDVAAAYLKLARQLDERADR